MSSNLTSNVISNSTATTTTSVYQSIINVLYSYYTLIAITGGTCLFLLAILRPIYEITKSRPALIILFSKLIGTILYTGFDAVTFLMNMIKLQFPFSIAIWIGYFVFAIYCSSRTHVLMLAVNRAHSVFFPFHYVQHAKKKFLLGQCAVAWLSALLLGVAAVLGGFVWPQSLYNGRVNVNLSPIKNMVIDQIVVYIAGLFYLMLFLKLVWRKYQMKSWNAHSSENDHARTTLACFASMCPFVVLGLCKLFVLYINTSTATNAGINAILGYIVSQCSNIGMCTEEWCLLAICGDFRRLVRAQLCCCCGASSNAVEDVPASSVARTFSPKKVPQPAQQAEPPPLPNFVSE